ncbi:CaiB/BaiF CoA transferase family protein [Sphingomonas solaris]|uniref:CoA transferase n=1 Tax=Alterirhizorhabdus solaris TaxID=2529389 RepID=A0A558RBG4_9SPHN|nr:CoA transferase [Sphingomonas solaris]TVV76716.1 CoA transferase [Sphingomonas solaris]
MTRPLDGIRVVELALEIQGPYAALTLSEMGADVIKVENRVGGDTSRSVPLAKMVADAPAELADFRHYFYIFNRGKRSVGLDLKSAGGRDALMRLLDTADVLVSNFRLGVLDRLGFGYDALKERFPRLIYAVASGWGTQGPRTHYPSRDMLAQAASGLMAKTGHDPDPPLPAGTNIADYGGAHMLVTAVLAALVQRGRTGRGQRVDVSLYGTMLAHENWELFQASLTGREPHRAGHAHPHMTGAWGGFRTADGWLVLSSIPDAVWPRFCEIIARPDLAADPQWTGKTRNVDGEAFRTIIAGAFTGRTTADWMAELGPAGVLATPAASYQDVLADPQAHASGYIREVAHPGLGTLRLVGSPIAFSDAALREAATAPALGADTDAVLGELGYTDTDIAGLRDAGVI